MNIFSKYRLTAVCIAAAACALTSSCTKNTVVGGGEHSLCFTTYSGTAAAKGAATKADGSLVDGTTFAEGKSFGVYTYLTGSTAFTGTTETANFMSDVEVTAGAGGATFSYSPTRYWPKDEANNLLTFWAYYPYGDANITSKPTSTTTGLGAIGFTVPTDATAQSDLMLSDVCSDLAYSTCTPTPGTVPLVFRHALTRIKFSAKTDAASSSATVSIESIKLKTVYNSGTLSRTSPTAAFTWTLPSTPTSSDYTVPLGTAADALTTTEAVVCSTPLLLLPQTLTEAGVKTTMLEITYTITTTSRTLTQTSRLELSNATVTAWTSNASINYVLTVGVNPIQFSATLGNDWTAPGHDITIE